MMILDGHIHILEGAQDRERFYQRLTDTGIDGAVVISLPPEVFADVVRPRPAEVRLEDLFLWTGGRESLFPFFWVDPLEEDAVEQVRQADARGVYGFKVTCNRFYPEHPDAMAVFRAIAETGKPILFHSGILWDGRASSKYNHPENFEALLEVPHLKFSLAHVSWPWCDEAIAVFGKFLNANTYRPELSVEMFIDISPGTPPIYREEVLRKMLTVGYDIQHHIIFGSDSVVNDYNCNWVRSWIERDDAIYDSIVAQSPEMDIQSFKRNIYGENLRRFLGLSGEKVERKPLRLGE